MEPEPLRGEGDRGVVNVKLQDARTAVPSPRVHVPADVIDGVLRIGR